MCLCWIANQVLYLHRHIMKKAGLDVMHVVHTICIILYRRECSNVKCTVIIPVGQTRSQCAKEMIKAEKHSISHAAYM